jgi:hypothetical protein
MFLACTVTVDVITAEITSLIKKITDTVSAVTAATTSSVVAGARA